MARGGDPKPLGDVLARFLKVSGFRAKLRSPAIYDRWPEVAGPEASRHSRVVGFHNGVLHVEVDSAPWLQVLSSFRKQELMTAANEVMRGVRVKDIRFKIGQSASQ
ncbi:MAG: DUF721 domain-containing protein [Planctomycetota bacterium]